MRVSLYGAGVATPTPKVYTSSPLKKPVATTSPRPTIAGTRNKPGRVENRANFCL